jgi:LysM repeat protein
MECYACDQEAIERCSRCGNLYCPAHGDASPAGAQTYCAECLDPVNATPSGVAFRASLFGLLIASVLALWLLIRPPSLPGESSGAIRPLPVVSQSAQPTTSPSAETAAPTSEATAPPEATATPEGTPAPTEAPPAGPIQYTMQEGDTVSGVAEQYGIRYLDLLAFNGLSEEDAAVLQPGDVISIPQ